MSDHSDVHTETPAAHAGHRHGVPADADRRHLTAALVLLVAFIAVEVVVGVLSGSLALISDAAHMLSDAAAIVFALIAMRLSARPPQGGYTFGLKRAEIMSAQINGLTLLLLAVYFIYEGIARLIHPPDVEGWPVLVTALAGIAVNVAAARLIGRADRTRLNIEGAYQHILNDLFAFIAAAVAGLVVMLTGFTRADAIAALVVAALMIKAGYELVRDSGRVFMEAAPAGTDPAVIGAAMADRPGVVEVHDLHVWEVTSGYPALSAHVLVEPGGDCHTVRRDVEGLLSERHHIGHTTLQVDHIAPETLLIGATPTGAHCGDAHGPAHRPAPAGPL
ncbi:cation diffusion facilitator family transporter [Actinomadura alba]|uniref:Cation transporter n=1 Tax=Actinomadura alba TaxID=406431 RepID=A0ABR7LSS3_9ACTN|nr:cation diffusion facilitator family transporter [Actinomadura alba]MBC6467882.1 cation transporter [Actinomadura alba]